MSRIVLIPILILACLLLPAGSTGHQWVQHGQVTDIGLFDDTHDVIHTHGQDHDDLADLRDANGAGNEPANHGPERGHHIADHTHDKAGPVFDLAFGHAAAGRLVFAVRSDAATTDRSFAIERPPRLKFLT